MSFEQNCTIDNPTVQLCSACWKQGHVSTFLVLKMKTGYIEKERSHWRDNYHLPCLLWKCWTVQFNMWVNHGQQEKSLLRKVTQRDYMWKLNSGTTVPNYGESVVQQRWFFLTLFYGFWYYCRLLATVLKHYMHMYIMVNKLFL